MRWWYLLPSGNPNRAFTCVSCGKKYDLTDAAKSLSIMGALIGVGPALVVVGKISRHGQGQMLWVGLGTAAAAAVFLTITVLVGSIALRLVAKN